MILTSVFIVPNYFTLRFYRNNYFHRSLEEDIKLAAVCGKVVEAATKKCQHSIDGGLPRVQVMMMMAVFVLIVNWFQNGV